MSLSVANVQTILGRRCGALMTASGVTDYYDAISSALMEMGYSVADPTLPTDAEVAAVPNSLRGRFLDLAEMRLLENILGNLVVVDTDVGPVSEKLGQLAVLVQKRLDALEKKYGGAVGGVGVIAFNIAARGVE